MPVAFNTTVYLCFAVESAKCMCIYQHTFRRRYEHLSGRRFNRIETGEGPLNRSDCHGYERQTIRRVVAQSDPGPTEFRMMPISPDDTITIAGKVVDQDLKPLADIQLRLIVTEAKRPLTQDRFSFDWGSSMHRLGHMN